MLSIVTAMVLGSPLVQGATKDRGYIAAKFATPYGGISVYLPNDIAPGDRITGTVFTDSDADEFKGLTVDLGDVRGVAPKPNSRYRIFHVPTSVRSSVPLIVRAKDGKQLGAIRIGVSPAPDPVDAYTFPNFVQLGRPAVINGTFDGDITNTKFQFAGRDQSILAESPRSITIYVPYDSKPGPVSASIVEGSKGATAEIREISIDLHAGKEDLKKDEKTQVTLTVEGMAGLTEATIPFIQVQNLTPKILDLDGQEIHTVIPKLTPDGKFVKIFNAKSAGPGSFLLTTFVEPGPGIPVVPKIK